MLMGIENAKGVCDLSEVRNGLPSTAEPAQSSYSVLPLAGCSSNFLHQVPSLTQPARGKQICPAVPGMLQGETVPGISLLIISTLAAVAPCCANLRDETLHSAY